MGMRRNLVVHALALAAFAVVARAAERVTLSNGFEMRCDHHSPAGDRVRLYLTPAEDNYIEFAPRQVVAVEKLADASDSQSAAPPTSAIPDKSLKHPSSAAPDAKLSPADLAEMLDQAGHEHNLDVDLLASLVKAESGGNASAVSRAGARGLMQLMPATAADLGVQDSFKPDQNVRGGSSYLDALLIRYRDNLALALAAYNAGPAAVDKYRGIPPYHETRAYVARVIHEFNSRVLAREAQAGRSIASASTIQKKTLP